MRRATLHEFLEAPVGRWTHTSPLLAWAATPRLCGVTYTGLVTGTDVPHLRSLAAMPFHPALERPYRAIVDGGAIAGIDAPAFALLVEHLRGLEGIPGLVERIACVRPAGMTGAAAVGLFHEHLSRFDVRFVDDLESAIAIVEADDYREALFELREIVRGTSLVAALRGILRSDPRQRIAAVAAQLGVSTRTLQRACTRAGSSYRDEVAEARFAHADALLRSTSDKIEAIARRAGYSSPTSFTRQFNQRYGVTPNQFRRAQR